MHGLPSHDILRTGDKSLSDFFLSDDVAAATLTGLGECATALPLELVSCYIVVLCSFRLPLYYSSTM